MSISSKVRAERQAKERKRWKKRQQARYSAAPLVYVGDLDDIEDQLDILRFLPGAKEGEEIEIQYEAMPDPAFDSLPKQWRKRLAFIKTTLPEDMLPHLDVLVEAVVAELPMPLFWNLLGNAYLVSGKNEQAGMIFEETIRRFPHYFYGPTTYANWLIEQGRAGEALEVMGGNFDLPRLLHGRKIIHFREAFGFHMVRAAYYLAMKDLPSAAVSIDLMEMICPRDPATEELCNRLHRALKSQTGWLGRVKESWGRLMP